MSSCQSSAKPEAPIFEAKNLNLLEEELCNIEKERFGKKDLSELSRLEMSEMKIPEYESFDIVRSNQLIKIEFVDIETKYEFHNLQPTLKSYSGSFPDLFDSEDWLYVGSYSEVSSHSIYLDNTECNIL